MIHFFQSTVLSIDLDTMILEFYLIFIQKCQVICKYGIPAYIDLGQTRDRTKIKTITHFYYFQDNTEKDPIYSVS